VAKKAQTNGQPGQKKGKMFFFHNEFKKLSNTATTYKINNNELS